MVKHTDERCSEIMLRSRQHLVTKVPEPFCQDSCHGQESNATAVASIMKGLEEDSLRIIHQLRVGPWQSGRLPRPIFVDCIERNHSLSKIETKLLQTQPYWNNSQSLSQNEASSPWNQINISALTPYTDSLSESNVIAQSSTYQAYNIFFWPCLCSLVKASMMPKLVLF